MDDTETTKPTLVVLAAGMGTRYGGLKQVDPMGPGGETILDYSVYDAVRAGFGKVVFVIREDIEDAFRSQIGARFPQSLPVEYAFQRLEDVPGGFAAPKERAKPWGTAHAVWAARSAVNEPFAAINADDFYGREAYATLARFLMQDGLASLPCRNCMVGFRLKNTLSEHGSVARGICELDEQGRLISVEELTDIFKTDTGGGENRPADGAARSLSGDGLASMNMWGFSEGIFESMEPEFERFLREHGHENGSEFYITTVMDSLIRAGREQVRVLDTDSRWFGVTYKEDKPLVVAAISGLVDAGVYPKTLW